MLPLLSLIGCAHNGTEAVIDGRYADTPGTIHLFSDDLWTLTPDADPSTRLCLDDPLFTEALHVDGAKVLFSGKRLDPPENARMACNPVQLTSLRTGS